VSVCGSVVAAFVKDKNLFSLSLNELVAKKQLVGVALCHQSLELHCPQ